MQRSDPQYEPPAGAYLLAARDRGRFHLKATFDTAVAALRAVQSRFDADANAAKKASLGRLRKIALRDGKALLAYHESLLFLCAHPSDVAMLALVEAEFRRLASFLKARRGRQAHALNNEGLPFVDTVTRYSHDCVRWLLGHPDCTVAFEEFCEPSLDLNAVLRLTLPTLERNETTAGLSNDDLLAALGVRPDRRLAFLVAELSRLDGLPYVKDHLYDALDVFVRVTPTSTAFSKAYNRIPIRQPFYQGEPIRNFDSTALMNSRLPPARRWNAAQRAQVVQVIKNAMALTSRETDPATYLDDRSLRVFDLDRGLSVAIFGMTPERQLVLESYVGFTLFKNGLPAAYGGAWVLGERSNFGMNIFEAYRGGESGHMMCQVLRVYRQVFGARYFEVDAHQFGLDNPDGIATGAFWFYYRYGFRPISAALATLAQREKERIASRKGYRSSEKTLLKFTESNMALSFGGNVPPHLFDVTTRVTRMVQKHYGGDRPSAERDCVSRFVAAAGLSQRLDSDQRQVLAEVALIARALNVADEQGLQLLSSMISTKPADVYRYQQLLLAFFSQRRIKPSRA